MNKIKEHFTSRYYNEGCLIEADWSSLELVVWAFLTKDPLLYKLINSGQDMHRYVGSKVLGCKPEDITDEQRSTLKPANFNLVYGGTDWNLIHQYGLEPDFAKAVYETFWKLFPTAKLVQDNVFASVKASAKLIDEYTPLGVQKHAGYYKSITGRKYWFKTYDESVYQRKRGNLTKFKKAECYNYFVQGFATADIHMLALGNLFRNSINKRDSYLLINTVHDSVIIDCRNDYVEETCSIIKNSLEYIVVILKKVFNIDFDLPLKVELKMGKSWADMRKSAND